MIKVYIERDDQIISIEKDFWNYTYFSYLGGHIKFGIGKEDKIVGLGDNFEVYINNKLRWKRYKK